MCPQDASWPGKDPVLDFTSSKETVGVSLPPVMKQYVQSVVDSRWEQWRSEGWVGQQCIVDGIGSEVLYLCMYVRVRVHACALCVKVYLCFNAM